MTRSSVRKIRPVGADGPSNQASQELAPASGAAKTSAAEPPNAPLPHGRDDRDEGIGMTGGVQSARIQQGARDLKRGLRDTTRAPEADAAYRKLKA